VTQNPIQDSKNLNKKRKTHKICKIKGRDPLNLKMGFKNGANKKEEEPITFN